MSCADENSPSNFINLSPQSRLFLPGNTLFNTLPPLSLIRAKIERNISNYLFPFFVAFEGDAS
jgi:hypothetical protein